MDNTPPTIPAPTPGETFLLGLLKCLGQAVVDVGLERANKKA